MICARLDTLENLQRNHARDVSKEMSALKSQLDRIEKKQAREDGYEAGVEATYAKLGKKVTLVLAAIGAAWAFFHWFASEGGRDWIRANIFGP